MESGLTIPRRCQRHRTSPGVVGASRGCWTQMGERHDRHWGAGTAAVVAVNLGRCVWRGREAKGHDVAGSHEAERLPRFGERQCPLANDGGRRMPATMNPAASSGVRWARRFWRPERMRVLAVPHGKVEEVRDLLMGEIFEEGQAQSLPLRLRQCIDGGTEDRTTMVEPNQLLGARAVFGQILEMAPLKSGST